MRADLSRELARRRIALRCAPEPRRDLRQVIRETLAAAGADVAHQTGRARGSAAAHERLAPVRGIPRRAECPVRHATRLVFLRGLVEHAHPTAWIALFGAHDRANVVAELLVLGEADRRSREDAVGDVGLTPQQRKVGVVFRRAGRALPRKTVAVGYLAAIHPRA